MDNGYIKRNSYRSSKRRKLARRRRSRKVVMTAAGASILCTAVLLGIKLFNGEEPREAKASMGIFINGEDSVTETMLQVSGKKIVTETLSPVPDQIIIEDENQAKFSTANLIKNESMTDKETEKLQKTALVSGAKIQPTKAAAPTAKPTASPKPTKAATDSKGKGTLAEAATAGMTSKERADRITELEKQLADRLKTTAFIGNSRTEGLQINNKSCTSDFFCYRGLAVSTAVSKKLITLKGGFKGTVLDAVKEGTYTDIFIMFGVNELGWNSTEIFKKDYVELIEKIQKLQPDATIYVQSILPITSKTSKVDKIYNNTNVKKFNKKTIQAAKDTGAIYLDVATELCGKGNPLPSDAAGSDGIHLTKEYCQRWYLYLLEEMAQN